MAAAALVAAAAWDCRAVARMARLAQRVASLALVGLVAMAPFRQVARCTVPALAIQARPIY